MRAKIILSVLITIVLSFYFLSSNGATVTSTATGGNWSLPATWQGGFIPTAADDVVIANGATVTVDGFYSCLSLTIQNGGSATALNINSGVSLTVNGAVTYGTQSANRNFTIAVGAGSLICNTLTFAAPAANRGHYMTISTGSVKVLGNLNTSGTAAENQITFSGSGLLQVGGTLGTTATYTVSTGTIEFSGTSAQNIPILNVSYYTLKTSGSAVKTLSASVTCTNLFIGLGSTLYTNTFSITGNAAGTMTMEANTFLQLGNTASTTAVAFPSNFVNANIVLDNASTVVYQSNGAQTVSSTPTYKNLSLETSGIKTLAGNTTIGGTLGVKTNVTLDLAGKTNTVSGTSTIAGTIANSISGGTTTMQAVDLSGGTINCNTAALLTTILMNTLTVSTANGTLGNGNITVSGPTTVTANSLIVSSNSGTKVFGGNLSISSGATYNNSGNSIIEFRNGLQNDGTFTQGTGAYSFTTNSQSISGTGAVTFTGNVTVGTAITLTNSSTNATGVTFNGTLNGAAATSVFDNRGNCVYANTTLQPMNVGSLVADQTANTFTYSSGNQTIRDANYYHLATDGAGSTKTLNGDITILGNLTVPQQTITDAGNDYAITIKGNINSTILANFDGIVTVILSGTTTQTINIGTGRFTNLLLNNSNGTVLNSAVTINGTLTLTAGKISIGNYNLTFASSASAVSGTPGSTKMIVLNGTGEVRRNYAVANPLVSSFAFPIGDNSGNYSPITISFTSGNAAAGAYSSVKVSNTKHASNNSTSDYLNRYWTFNVANITAFAGTATCTFVTSDIVGTSTYIKGATYAASAWSANALINTVTNTFVVPITAACDISGIDGVGPYLSPVNIVSSNTHTDVVKAGETVILTFTTNETISSITVIIAGKTVVPTNVGSNYTASVNITSITPAPTDVPVSDGIITFSISAKDNMNNTSNTTGTTDLSQVICDRAAPSNQNTVFAGNQTVPSSSTVTIVSSGLATNQVWFAPTGLSNVTSFIEGLTMTKALDGTATSILAPTTPGTYYCYVIDYAGNVSAQSTATLTVYVAPTLADIETSTLTYIESSGQVSITSAITVSDDGANISSATITISNNYVNGQDVLSYVSVPPITGSWVAATGTLTLSGVTTKANYQTALQSVKYQNTASPATYSVRTISFKVNDGTYNSNIVTRNIDVVKKQPYITSTAVTSGYKTVTYTYNITVAEPGTITTISASGYPANITFTDFGNNTARLQGIPANAGSYPITITATDGTNTAVQNYTLTIGNTITVTAPASIQTAINSASAGDLVLVNPGTYTENIDFNNKNITVASTYLSTGNAANISTTIINGNNNGSVVTFKSGETSSAKLIGFTVTAGSGRYIDLLAQSFHSPYAYYGGGIYIYNSSPVVDNCIISNNSAKYVTSSNTGGNGGGIYIGGSAAPTISNCSVSNNSSSGYRGGGICIDNSSVIISNTVIQSNTGGNYGGGIACYNSTLTISGCTISSNTAANGAGIGGGIIAVKSTLDISTTSLSSNTATKSGNGSYTYGCTKTGTFSGADTQVNVP